MRSAGAQRGNPMRGKTNTLQHKKCPGWARSSINKTSLAQTRVSFCYNDSVHYAYGDIAQLIRVLPWHGRSRGFESLYLHQKLFMKKTNKNATIEYIGWIGVVLVVGSYGLLALGFVNSSSILYHSLVLLGASGVAIVSYKKRSYQPAVLNGIFAILAVTALMRIIFT